MEFPSHIKVYLVGGSVRDQILNVPSKDKDYVVVGATPNDMFALGFHQVGKDFPVFLHPKTGEEYALARRERKIANGYKGFEVDASPNVTLKEDLKRRDLTINAMAFDGKDYIDPFNGLEDLKHKILRPVSNAFKEDPVRVLRLARFKTRFQNFKLHESCTSEISSMRDELKHLKPERVRLELEKALLEKKPSIFFKTLFDLNVLDVIFPSIFALYGVEQSKQYHPEGDAFVHTLCVLDAIRQETQDLICLYTGLLHDLGKALTPKEIIPKHIGHEHRGLAPVKEFLNHYGILKHKNFILAFVKYHLHIHRLFDLKPKTLIEVLDAFKIKKLSDENLKRLLICAKADIQGRVDHFKQEDYLKAAVLALELIDFSDISHNAKNIKDVVCMRKIKALEAIYSYS
ncbi:MAG: multifunctional CCA tRNA nucleotidyl transferase/2'3'-cyclic phosphodiesterase/2'nucleotidase/phosphatase [Proteobacteria bacterium]|nr:multifunctional CCA tRNA nucleotidyl transferase/2'3'-cyclic phosphodiesterase/2'nucleotidase/phosphatase [Pseudomonadota bacterium]